MLKYVYGMRQRGCSPGCQPKEGFIRRENEQVAIDMNSDYWDVISYNRELTDEEMKHFSLDYLGTRPIDE